MSNIPFLTKAEMAERLRVDERTIERYCARGILPYVKLGRGNRATLRFHWPDVVARLNQKFGFNLTH